MIGKRPFGVIVFGIILILTSLDQLRHIAPYPLYKSVNHEWPENIIKVRFIGSYIFRLIGLASGVGILCLSESFRKFLVGFSYYCIITLPLRHTYNAQLFFSEPIYHQYGSIFSLQTFTWIAVIIRWFIDGAFSISAIYYFTRPKVTQHFTLNAAANDRSDLELKPDQTSFD